MIQQNEKEALKPCMPDHNELAKTILRFMDQTANNSLLDRSHLERSIADAVWMHGEFARGYGMVEARAQPIEGVKVDVVERVASRIQDKLQYMMPYAGESFLWDSSVELAKVALSVLPQPSEQTAKLIAICERLTGAATIRTSGRADGG